VGASGLHRKLEHEEKTMTQMDDPQREGDMPKPGSQPGGDWPKPDTQPGGDMPKPGTQPDGDTPKPDTQPEKPEDPGRM
jgi:hypothetical protein